MVGGESFNVAAVTQQVAASHDVARADTMNEKIASTELEILAKLRHSSLIPTGFEVECN